MGSSSVAGPNMNMSLDDMIASRQKKDGTRRSSRNRNTVNVNKVSNADRAVGTSRAKREAALRARRGLSKSGKASQMDIEKEVQKQHKKTVLDRAKKVKQSKRVPKSSALRQERRQIARAAAKAKKEELAVKGRSVSNRTGNKTKVAESAPLGRPPSKKAVNAAVSAMEDKGFNIPDGYQMVISFAPTASNTVVSNDSKPEGKRNTSRGRRGGGRGGRGRN